MCYADFRTTLSPQAHHTTRSAAPDFIFDYHHAYVVMSGPDIEDVIAFRGGPSRGGGDLSGASGDVSTSGEQERG